VKYVTELTPRTTYVAALQAIVISHLGQRPESNAALDRARSYLIGAMRPDGSYCYSMEEARGETPGDFVNTSFALQGMLAMAEAGIEPPVGYWASADQYWRKHQLPEGGWSDEEMRGSKLKTPSLAASAMGAANLMALAGFLDTEPRPAAKLDKELDSALAWVNGDFASRAPGATQPGDLFTWRAVERLALDAGLKRLGNSNWYAQVAEELIRTQGKKGEWNAAFWSSAGAKSDLYGTAEAILFLVDGGGPVIFNKLQYDGPWDTRPRDDANMTRWLGKQFEEQWNWQSVSVQSPVEAFLNAPVLLITGSKDPNFTPADVAKLRAYVNAGGLILSTADGPDFTVAVQKYVSQLAGDRYEFRELPADHPALSLWSKVGMTPRLMGLSNGVRELWIHSPQDLGAAWQGRRLGQKDPWTIAANIYYYATGKGTPWETPPAQPTEVTAKSVRTIHLARVQYAGNWDPEPDAWTRMAATASGFHTDLVVTPSLIHDLDARMTPVAHVTGTGAVTWPKEDVAALRAYLDAGGTLIGDAAGGNAAFADSFRQLAAELIPGRALTVLPLNHAVYNGALPDTVLADSAEFTKYAVGLHGRSSVPRMLGVVDEKGRAVVVFSPDDLTYALLGTNTWGIAGYDHHTAQTLVRNLLLVATQRSRAEARVPAASEHTN